MTKEVKKSKLVYFKLEPLGEFLQWKRKTTVVKVHNMFSKCKSHFLSLAFRGYIIILSQIRLTDYLGCIYDYVSDNNSFIFSLEFSCGLQVDKCFETGGSCNITLVGINPLIKLR